MRYRKPLSEREDSGSGESWCEPRTRNGRRNSVGLFSLGPCWSCLAYFTVESLVLLIVPVALEAGGPPNTVAPSRAKERPQPKAEGARRSSTTTWLGLVFAKRG
jgi:hypothetical protein